MGGHSHWSTIKRHKSAQDAKRGRIFTRITRELITAARIGGGDSDGNARLRTAIAKAREVNLPQENIRKAIRRGTGELPGVSFEEAVYEGYGPGGVALMIEAMTDNRNRTVSVIRKVLSKHGGSLGAAGCVAWMFRKKGCFLVDRTATDEESLLGLVLEAGAEDLKVGEKNFEITTAPEDFEAVRQSLAQNRIQTGLAEVILMARDFVRLEGTEARQVLRLCDDLDDQEDVQKVHTNFDIPDQVIQEVSAGL